MDARALTAAGQWGKQNGLKTGTVMWPVRIACQVWHQRQVLGLAQILGKAESRRIQAGLAMLTGN